MTFKTSRGPNSRQYYTTLVAFWAFLSQVLDDDGGCRRAVTRLQTLCCALKLRLPDEETGACCTARARLPIRVRIKVFYFIAARFPGDPARSDAWWWYNLVRYFMLRAEAFRPLETTNALSFKGSVDRLDQ